MELTSLFSYIVVPLYVGILIYLANQVDLERSVRPVLSEFSVKQNTTFVRWMLYGLIGALVVTGLFLIQAMLLLPSMQDAEIALPEIDTSAGIVGFATAVVVAVVAIRLIQSEATRVRVGRLTGVGSGFDPQSSVHLVAVVLLLWYVAISFVLLIMAGGVTGLAQSIQDAGINIGELVFQGALLTALGFLGVGLAIRRGLQQALERLKVSLPTVNDVVIGVAAGIGLMFLAGILIQIWGALVSPEQFAQQSSAANEIGKQVNSLGLAFVLALSAAISEEILFRGALQPIIGVPLTAVFFTLFHSQYTLTPAALVIFVVGLALGLLRRRYNTSVAMITHFIYNFLPFAVLFLLPQVAERLGIS